MASGGLAVARAGVFAAAAIVGASGSATSSPFAAASAISKHSGPPSICLFRRVARRAGWRFRARRTWRRLAEDIIGHVVGRRREYRRQVRGHRDAAVASLELGRDLALVTQILERVLLAHSFRTGTGRYDPFGKSSANDRYLQILLKNSEIEPPRKSRFRARRVISADSPHGRAYRSVARGKAGRSADPPKEFFIEDASGLLNCDRCGNSSFSTLSAHCRRPLRRLRAAGISQ
jgi:hypothetical protein